MSNKADEDGSVNTSKNIEVTVLIPAYNEETGMEQTIIPGFTTGSGFDRLSPERLR